MEPNIQPHNLRPHTLTNNAERRLQVRHMVGYPSRSKVLHQVLHMVELQVEFQVLHMTGHLIRFQLLHMVELQVLQMVGRLVLLKFQLRFLAFCSITGSSQVLHLFSALFSSVLLFFSLPTATSAHLKTVSGSLFSKRF